MVQEERDWIVDWVFFLVSGLYGVGILKFVSNVALVIICSPCFNKGVIKYFLLNATTLYRAMYSTHIA